jgi:hypothetical protein
MFSIPRGLIAHGVPRKMFSIPRRGSFLPEDCLELEKPPLK